MCMKMIRKKRLTEMYLKAIDWTLDEETDLLLCGIDDEAVFKLAELDDVVSELKKNIADDVAKGNLLSDFSFFLNRKEFGNVSVGKE